MSESTKESSVKSGVSGWLKALIASVFSAASGAALMYASPLLDSVIKPAKPVANFQAQPSGLKVTFQNKSTGGTEGWWDFGDGSALEPFVPDEPAIVHSYAKGGNYTVKLSLKNFIHEQNERAATVALDAEDASAPVIETFEVVPVRGDYAPAAFQIVTKVKNADMCVWALGDRDIEFSPDTANGAQKRYVSLKEPGTYALRLAAFNGKQTVEKSARVVVKAAPAGMVTATLTAVYEAVHTDRKVTKPFIQLHFPADKKGNVETVTAPIHGSQGMEIVKAEVVQPIKDAYVKSAKVQIDPAKRDTGVLTCELIKPPAKGNVAPASLVQLELTQQRQGAKVTKSPEPLSINLAVPGTTLVPLPALQNGWEAKSRKMTLALQQDSRPLAFYDGTMPQNATVVIGATTYVVNAVEQNGQLRIDVVGKGATNVIGN